MNNTNRKRSLKLVQAAHKRSRNQSQNINFDQFVEERKEEKRKALKEKLEQRLKTIRDRRVSGVNTEPFPEGAFELLESNNIWEEVLGYLTDPVDVTSAYHTCKKFAEITETPRILAVMPKMLTTLKASFPSENWYWNMICFNIRGVSKAWKEIANFQLFDAPFSKANWYETQSMPSQYDFDWTLTSCLFEDEASVDQATSVLCRQGQPPSFSIRNVMVVLDEEVPEGFYEKVIEFLRTHGKFVWFFLVEWSWRSTVNLAESYGRLCEMLELMPTLKGLNLCDTNGKIRTIEEIQNFQQRSHERQIPVPESLEYLFFNMTTGEPLLSQISRKCINLKSVFYRPVLDVPLVAESLRELSLEHYYGPIRPIIMRSLMPLTDVWPLKSLSIELKEGVKASVLIPALNRFRETLQELHITEFSIEMDILARIRNIRLDLPRLKYLLLDIIGRGCGTLGFDDLLLLRSLRQLHLITNILQEDVVECLGENSSTKVKVAESLENWELDKSNVWGWFPNLMWIEIGHEWKFNRPDEH